jgi:VIT1/CCC1 family predicted Fe2+/Mn2+ transporter
VRKAIAKSIDQYLTSPLTDRPVDDALAEHFRSRAGVLANECGCAMGGAFLVASAVVAAVYLFLFGHFTITAIVVSVAVTFASAMAGKAVGIGTACARLLLLRRQLRTSVAMR